MSVRIEFDQDMELRCGKFVGDLEDHRLMLSEPKNLQKGEQLLLKRWSAVSFGSKETTWLVGVDLQEQEENLVVSGRVRGFRPDLEIGVVPSYAEQGNFSCQPVPVDQLKEGAVINFPNVRLSVVRTK